MIIGKNSWKFLLFAFIILLVTGAAGGIAASVGGFFPHLVGALNVALGVTYIVVVYNKLKEK